MYAKISLISAIMKLKKSLDDFGTGEVKNPETLPNSLENTLLKPILMIIWSFHHFIKRLTDLKCIWHSACINQ